MKLVSIVFAVVLLALAVLNAVQRGTPDFVPPWLQWTGWLRWLLVAAFALLALQLLRRPGTFGGLLGREWSPSHR